MAWGMGSLAAQDGYDSNAFDVPGEQTYDRRLDQTWPGRLAQDAMGAVLAPGRALQATEPITTEQMIKPAADLAGLVMGGGIGGTGARAGETVLGSGPVMTRPLKPLPEKQFYNQYSQHVDLRNRGNAAAADEVQRQIMEEGFRQSLNVNTLPAYRGGPPRNIVDMKLAPKSGDTVYLVPNTATTEMGNGLTINRGWKPEPHEILKIAEDYPSLYKEYLKALERAQAIGSLADQSKYGRKK